MIKSAVCYSLGLRSQEATSYVRIISPLRNSNIEIINGIQPNGNIDLDLVQEGDVVIVQRDFPRYFEEFCSLVDKCRSYNKKLIFDLDDLLFELPEYHYDRQKHRFAPYLLPIYYAIQEADLVTVPTRTLKEYVSSINENVLVLPNYLDDQLWKAKSSKENNSGKIIIGYIGTVTHFKDLESISHILINLLDKFEGKVELKIWGFEPPEDLCKHPNISYNSLFYVSYPAFAKWFQTVTLDIAIAPLIDNLFNKCKSSLKFLEYSINGISGVYSDIETYNSVVVDGDNGLLAHSPEDWEVALYELIENAELRTRMAARARETVEQSWTWSVNTTQWLSTIMRGLSAIKQRPSSRFIIRSIAEQNLDLMQAFAEAEGTRTPIAEDRESNISRSIYSQCILEGVIMRDQNTNAQIRASQLKLHCYNAALETGHFDPCWLDVVQVAPAWLTRAERLMLFTLAFSLRPKCYIEIGTFQGGSALIVCRALDALESDGRMYLVDPAPKIAPETWERIRHRARLYQGHSPDILEVVAAEAGGRFDLIFIDRDHSYKGVLRDAEGVLPYVEPGSYIIFHDIFFEDVRRAVDDFVAQYSDRLADLGAFTREFTTQQVNSGLIKWGGLRLVHIVG